MLLPIKPGTPPSQIFSRLNQELGFFLSACVNSKIFNKDLFSPFLSDAIWANTDTREKFQVLWMGIDVLPYGQKQDIADNFTNAQSLEQYYQDKNVPLPSIPNAVKNAFEDVSKHLFNRTSKLHDIEQCCGETIQGHFNTFRQVNQNVCCMCGTDILAPYRADVNDDAQWRGPYDHLLSKDKYPLFAVHPDNLIPICDKCNSKAKLAKDLLVNKNNSRRLCFYPFLESSHNHVNIYIQQMDMNLSVRIVMHSDQPCIQEKLDTWDDVYRIKERVEGEFLKYIYLIDTDCRADDLNDFRARINSNVANLNNNIRLSPWNFWKYKLYDWLNSQGGDVIEILWDMILSIRKDEDAREVYGI